MVRSSQVSGVGKEPLQTTGYIRGNGSHPRRGSHASLVRVLPKPSRTPTLPSCAEPSSDRSELGTSGSKYATTLERVLSAVRPRAHAYGFPNYEIQPL